MKEREITTENPEEHQATNPEEGRTAAYERYEARRDNFLIAQSFLAALENSRAFTPLEICNLSRTFPRISCGKVRDLSLTG